jgi:hypothetical protein
MMSSSAMVISNDIRLYACSKSRMTGWIFIKFVMHIIPFEADPKSYFLVS